MIAVVLSQQLRINNAYTYLAGLTETGRAVLITTAQPATKDRPDGVEVVVPGSGSVVASTAPTRQGLRERLAKAARSGSPVASRLSRWAHSAEWKMRYARRFLKIAGAGSARQRFLTASELIAEMDRLDDGSGYTELAVFDLFDLAAAIEAAETHGCRVVVR